MRRKERFTDTTVTIFYCPLAMKEIVSAFPNTMKNNLKRICHKWRTFRDQIKCLSGLHPASYSKHPDVSRKPTCRASSYIRRLEYASSEATEQHVPSDFSNKNSALQPLKSFWWDQKYSITHLNDYCSLRGPSTCSRTLDTIAMMLNQGWVSEPMAKQAHGASLFTNLFRKSGLRLGCMPRIKV